ncbi:MAG TPA: hypothetical protein VN345_13100 [Blastocatellia bacterium]|jgi:hypothetical protein|nr:hypothetical protein [Blastocatellia bacterium]
MKLVDTVNRAMNEPDFARRLKRAAVKAAPTPAGSNEWNDFLGFFAATPGELAALNTPVSAGAGPATPGIPTIPRLIGAAATSTNACTVTTTTTTGSYACAEFDFSHEDRGEDGMIAA